MAVPTTALDELDALRAADPVGADPTISTKALVARHAAARVGDDAPAGAPAEWPPRLPDPFPGLVGLPELSPSELTTSTVGGSILHHGAVVVRGLVPPAEVQELVDGVDRAFDAFDRWVEHRDPDVAPWFVRFGPGKAKNLGNMRSWVRQSGAVWAAECPPVAGRLLAIYEAAGLRDVLTGYFGERPALSVNKFTLRRATPEANPVWHQDGAFLGDGVRSVNIWVTLTDCGGEAPVPGLDVLPRRLDEILETGTRGSTFKDSIGPDLVAEVAGATPIVRPTFAAGDALVFDERFVHRTATEPGMTGVRYAVESWFFSPSHYPPSYVPLLF